MKHQVRFRFDYSYSRNRTSFIILPDNMVHLSQIDPPQSDSGSPAKTWIQYHTEVYRKKNGVNSVSEKDSNNMWWFEELIQDHYFLSILILPADHGNNKNGVRERFFWWKGNAYYMKCSECEFFGTEQDTAYCYFNGFQKSSVELLRTVIKEDKKSVLKVITPNRRRIPVEFRQSQPTWCPLLEKPAIPATQ